MNRTLYSVLLAAPLLVALPSVAQEQASPPAAPPTLSGQLHLSITDGKGGTQTILIPDKEPLKIDLTPWKDFVARAGGISGLAESANAAFESWAGDFSRRLAAHQQAKTPWLGVAVQPLPASAAAQFPDLKGAGLIVRDVSPGSPAAAAGLQADDVLVRLKDQVLFSEEQLKKLVASLEVGAALEVVWLHGGKETKAQCTLGNAPHPGFNEAVAAALLGPKNAQAFRNVMGPDGEKLLGKLLTNPRVLEQLPRLQGLLRAGADGSLDLSQLQTFLEQARQSAPEWKFFIEEMVRAAQSEADLNAIAERLRTELDAVSPEVRERAAGLLRQVVERLQKAAGK